MTYFGLITQRRLVFLYETHLDQPPLQRPLQHPLKIHPGLSVQFRAVAADRIRDVSFEIGTAVSRPRRCGSPNAAPRPGGPGRPSHPKQQTKLANEYPGSMTTAIGRTYTFSRYSGQDLPKSPQPRVRTLPNPFQIGGSSRSKSKRVPATNQGHR